MDGKIDKQTLDSFKQFKSFAILPVGSEKTGHDDGVLINLQTICNDYLHIFIPLNELISITESLIFACKFLSKEIKEIMESENGKIH